MSNKLRFDNKGNVFQTGECQNKDGRYCYRYMDKKTGKRITIYSLSLEELRYKKHQIRAKLLDEINSYEKNVKSPYIIELIHAMNREFERMRQEIDELRIGGEEDMSRVFALVYEEKDYSRFKRLENNRDVTETRKEKLKASIASGEVLNPIIVNEKMEIIDGQGRYEAKKELGLPIQYVISEGAGIKECQKMNKYNTKWTFVDYIQSYATLGNENYINFQKACEKIKCPPTKTATFANLLNGGSLTDKIQDGTLQFNEELYKYTIRNFNYFSDILEALMHQGRVNQSFVLAAIILFDHPEYSHNKMIEQCKRYRASFVQMARREDQVKELQRIYNMRAKKKIYFEDYFRANNRRGNSEKNQEFNWEKEKDISTLKRTGKVRVYI